MGTQVKNIFRKLISIRCQNSIKVEYEIGGDIK